MEITNIEAIPIEASVEPKENEGGIAPYITSVSRIERSQRMLVRLETDTGTTGWGESMIEMDPIAMQTLIEREIAPNAIGRPAWQIEKFVNDYFYYYVDIKSLLGPVEMAMWDAFGKELGAPVHQLLGGKV